MTLGAQTSQKGKKSKKKGKKGMLLPLPLAIAGGLLAGAFAFIWAKKPEYYEVNPLRSDCGTAAGLLTGSSVFPMHTGELKRKIGFEPGRYVVVTAHAWLRGWSAAGAGGRHAVPHWDLLQPPAPGAVQPQLQGHLGPERHLPGRQVPPTPNFLHVTPMMHSPAPLLPPAQPKWLYG